MVTTSPIDAVRALPRFAYLSPAEAREVVLAVLGAVDVEIVAGAILDRVALSGHNEAHAAARAAIDALVAELKNEHISAIGDDQ